MPGEEGTRKARLGAQSVHLSITLLRHTSRDDEGPAGLALISSLRKRLGSLPAELSADVMWRGALEMRGLSGAEQAAVSGLSRFIQGVMWQLGACACCRQARQGQVSFNCGSCCVDLGMQWLLAPEPESFSASVTA